MKLLLYCTKSKPYLVKEAFKGYMATNNLGVLEEEKERFILNGKIVAECDYEVEEIECIRCDLKYIEYHYITKTLSEKELLKKSCLDFPKLQDYLRLNNGYAIHIKNLNIFDKPRELKNYKIKKEFLGGKQVFWKELKNAPQNMMYCYGNNTGEKYILISIRPEWLVKILNGEKTIEVRKKVLKEMI